MDISRRDEIDPLLEDHDVATSDSITTPLLDMSNVSTASTDDDVVMLTNPVYMFSPRGVHVRREHTISLLSAVAAPFPSATTVRRLLAAKADPNEASVIMVAATGGHVEVVDALIEAHADVNTRDRYGHRALLLAAARGHAGVVSTLVRAKAVVDARDRMGATALSGACALGQAHVVQVLLEAHANPNSSSLWGGSCLTLAAGRGCVPVVQMLVATGAALEARDGSRRTALTEAARLDRVAALSVLLEARADVDARDRDGVSALMSLCARAAARPEAPLVGLQVRRERDADVSYWGGVWGGEQDGAEGARVDADACERGELVQRMVSRSHRVDVRDRWGRSALMHASAAGWGTAVLALLRAGADASLRDVNGRGMAELWPHRQTELLRLCAEAGRMEVVHALATESALCCVGRSRECEWRVRGEALAQACASGETQTVRALLTQWQHEWATAVQFARQAAQAAHEEKERTVTSDDDDQSAVTPPWRCLWWARSGPTTGLGVACAHGHASVVDELIRARADVDAREGDGATALLRAVRSGSVEAVQALVEAGADVDVCAEDGKGAVEVAVELVVGAQGGADAAWSILAALLGCGRAHQHSLDRGVLMAAEGAPSRVVEALLFARADANASGKGDRSALIAATASGCAATVAVLLRHGARTQERDCRGVSALWAAVLGGHGDAAAALVQAGADVTESAPAEEEEDETGGVRVSMLHAAVRVRNNEAHATSARGGGVRGVVRALLHGRAEVDAVDREGRTALMVAAGSVRAGLVAELLQRGADPFATDASGMNALMWAACGQAVGLRVLLEYVATLCGMEHGE